MDVSWGSLVGLSHTQREKSSQVIAALCPALMATEASHSPSNSVICLTLHEWQELFWALGIKQSREMRGPCLQGAHPHTWMKTDQLEGKQSQERNSVLNVHCIGLMEQLNFE